MSDRTARPETAEPSWLVDLKRRNAAFDALSWEEQRAKVVATIQRVREQPECFGELQRISKAYATEREATARRRARQRLAPAPARRATSTARPRERRASRSRSTRAGPSVDDGPSDPSARLCACGCGRDISHKRADATTFNAGCRKRLERAKPRGGCAKECHCDPRVFAVVDPDGDLTCVSCGRFWAHVAPPIVGFDALARIMQTDGDGQPYSVARPRPAAHWRDREAMAA